MTALIADVVARHVAVSSTLPVFEADYAPPSKAIDAPTLATLAPEQRDYVVAIRKFLFEPFPADVVKNILISPLMKRDFLQTRSDSS